MPSVPSKPYPFFQGLTGIELHPLDFFSITAQFNFKTPTLTGNVPPSNDFYYYGVNDFLSLPQINTLVGIVFAYKGARWQIMVEEDSFTNAGIDVTFNFRFSQYLKLNGIF